MKDRLFFFWFMLFSFFGILFFRLFWLTIIEGDKNRVLADGQRIRLVKIRAPRGEIFDRNGKLLTRNIPLFRKCETENEKCQEITREEALDLEVQGKESQIQIDVGRDYLYGEATAHLLGYLGEASKEEIESGRWKAGDFLGKTGVEEAYEKVLGGKDGAELLEVDTWGRTVRKIGQKEPVAGKTITLSIDADLQNVAFRALEGKKGAVVAQNPKTGEILALVSSPSFDPNQITEKDLLSPDNPFFNRAISGNYPPGSTFKIVTSAAALEEGKITGDTKIEDSGVITVGRYRYANWYFTQYGKTEGIVNVVWALKRSTDTFFYKVGEWVGAKKLVEWGRRFGLGRVLGIDIPGESAGFLPDPDKDWFLGNTYHLSIGQGNLGLTPLQVNAVTAMIASGGKLCKPRVLKMEEGKTGDCQDIDLKKETINLISAGMREACSLGGTAFPLFNFTPPVACKTGTAEFDDPRGRTHAWLTAFAPVGNPEIVVTALVEAGGEGSRVAAPIVRKVLEEYFRDFH